MWFFGERYEIPELQDAVVSLLNAEDPASSYWLGNQIPGLYQKTSEGCLLRQAAMRLLDPIDCGELPQGCIGGS